MEKENFGLQEKICMRENGKMIKLMGMGFIYKKTGLNMKDIGRMIYKMDLERKFGLIILNMKACIRKGKSMAMDNIYFQIQQCTMEFGTTTRWKGKEHIKNRMDKNICIAKIQI